MSDIFDIPVSLSPRRAWLDRHGLTLAKLPSGAYECRLDDENFGRGEDEDAACVDFCLKHRVAHWNQI
jgi:hypothetical protein